MSVRLLESCSNSFSFTTWAYNCALSLTGETFPARQLSFLWLLRRPWPATPRTDSCYIEPMTLLPPTSFGLAPAHAALPAITLIPDLAASTEAMPMIRWYSSRIAVQCEQPPLIEPSPLAGSKRVCLAHRRVIRMRTSKLIASLLDRIPARSKIQKALPICQLNCIHHSAILAVLFKRIFGLLLAIGLTRHPLNKQVIGIQRRGVISHVPY